MDQVPPQPVQQCSRGTDLGKALANEGLDQILDLVDHQPAPGLLFLFSRVPPVQPSGKDFLRLGACHRQGDASVRTNGVFAQQ